MDSKGTVDGRSHFGVEDQASAMRELGPDGVVAAQLLPAAARGASRQADFALAVIR